MNKHKKTNLSRKKKYVFIVIVFFLSFTFTVIFAEFMVRIISPQFMVPRFVESASWGIRKNIGNVKALHQSPEYEYLYTTNSAGFRGEEEYSIEKPEGLIRVVVQGDSVTLGHGVGNNETFSHLLQKQFRDEGISLEAINMAVSGFGTAEEIIQFENDGLKYKPDIVILGYFQNDDLNNHVSQLYDITNGVLIRKENTFDPGVFIRDRMHSIPFYNFLSQHSHLVTFLRNQASALVLKNKKKRTFSQVSESLEEKNSKKKASLLTQLLLNEYINVVSKTGASLIIVDIVDKNLNSDFPYKAFENLENVYIISTYEAFRKKKDENITTYYEIDSHPTFEGHKLIHDVIYPTLKNIILCKLKSTKGY